VGGWHDLNAAGALQGPQRGRETDTHPHHANHHRVAHERTDHNSTNYDSTGHNGANNNGANNNGTDRNGTNNSTGHDGPDHDRANDDPTVADVDGSKWVVAELTAGKDLRKYVVAERTGKRPCWCHRCSRRQQQLP